MQIPWNMLRNLKITKMIGSDFDENKVNHPPRTVKCILQMYNCKFLKFFVTKEYDKWLSSPSKVKKFKFLSNLFHQPYTSDIAKIVNMLIVIVKDHQPEVFLIICGMLYWKWECLCKHMDQIFCVDFLKQVIVCKKLMMVETFAASNRDHNRQLFQKYCTILNSRRFDVKNLDNVWSHFRTNFMEHMLIPLWNRTVCDFVVLILLISQIHKYVYRLENVHLSDGMFLKMT